MSFLDDLSVVFVSNSISSLHNYRAGLISELIDNNYTVNYWSPQQALYKCVFNRDCKTIISSDTKSNIIVLLTSNGQNVLILNGMGRYEKSKWVRLFLIKLFAWRKNTHICVQNYRDYRYLRKYVDTNRITWVVGSGGQKRETNQLNTSSSLIISRNAKFPRLYKKLQNSSELGPVDVIGLTEKWKRNDIRSLGRVPQKEIFKKHYRFLQFYYYGEGFPHSLADAFCSKMLIKMDKKSYINFGIYKFVDANKKNIELRPDTLTYKNIVKIVEMKKINQKYMKIIKLKTVK